MKTEYEVKFVAIDVEKVRHMLEAAAARLESPMRLMRRVVIETPELKSKNAYVRVRDEGDRVTMTYKQFDALSIDGAREHEIVVDDFDESVALLGASGLPYRSFQESRRETWKYGDVEVVIDEWPWLAPYIEIEGNDEQGVKAAADALGFAWDDAVFGDVMAAYRVQYPHLGLDDTIGAIAEVRFDAPLPDLLTP